MILKTRSNVYDLYWKFAAERQNIFFKKLKGQDPPYTNDPILATYKFCNAYRASDRVSQYLIKNVIYASHKHPAVGIIFRVFLFRLFNKIDTWERLEEKFGQINLKGFSPNHYHKVLEEIRAKGEPIYGNAYILCANKVFGYAKKHQNHLELLKRVFKTKKTHKHLLSVKSLEETFNELKKLPLIGDFMAYQIAIDFNYSEVFDFDENEFTTAGPGAIRGINKIFPNTGNKSASYIIRYMVDNQEKEFARLGLKFKNLFGRQLHAIDCQNLFCEVDKYTRVSMPRLKSNRVKIKTKYKPKNTGVDYFYPPKWGINKKIQRY